MKSIIKCKAAEDETTHRFYVCVFFHAICITQWEVAPDAQIWGSQIKGHSDGSLFLLDLNMFGVPVYNQYIQKQVITRWHSCSRLELMWEWWEIQTLSFTFFALLKAILLCTCCKTIKYILLYTYHDLQWSHWKIWWKEPYLENKQVCL